mmetsp:Transcript_38529/g.120602  ORF Transcript_38529/g.120602 Transcript_38529/m.120602 type:complete len:201 (+) Transcript_38529:2816-3418(+)
MVPQRGGPAHRLLQRPRHLLPRGLHRAALLHGQHPARPVRHHDGVLHRLRRARLRAAPRLAHRRERVRRRHHHRRLLRGLHGAPRAHVHAGRQARLLRARGALRVREQDHGGHGRGRRRHDARRRRLPLPRAAHLLREDGDPHLHDHHPLVDLLALLLHGPALRRRAAVRQLQGHARFQVVLREDQGRQGGLTFGVRIRR